MKNLKLLAALLALTIGLAGCGGSSKGGSPASSASKNKLDGDNMTASSTQEQEYEEPEDVTYMRLLAGEDEYRACVLYLSLIHIWASRTPAETTTLPPLIWTAMSWPAARSRWAALTP